jgi:hypothetical protein
LSIIGTNLVARTPSGMSTLYAKHSYRSVVPWGTGNLAPVES